MTAAKPRSSIANEAEGEDWVGVHEALRARFLRRLSEVIDTLLLPQLGGQAAEVAGYTSFLVQRMAADDDMTPAIGEQLNAALDAEAGRAISVIATLDDSGLAARLTERLEESRAPGTRPASRSRMLRGILGLAARRRRDRCRRAHPRRNYRSTRSSLVRRPRSGAHRAECSESEAGLGRRRDQRRAGDRLSGRALPA
jgi:hypothetical protein